MMEPVLNDGYWPWWLGALALATIAVGHLLFMGRVFGLSGAWARLLNLRKEQEEAEAEAAFSDEELEAAMLAAALQEFGDDLPIDDDTPIDDDLPDEPAYFAEETGPAIDDTPPVGPPPKPAWSSTVTFLVMVILGALLASVPRGEFGLRFDLGPEYSRLVAEGWFSWVTLLLGGLLVGFGTQMAGGCSAGHGLNGCSRLQPGSLLATVAFFGAAVGVSLLMDTGVFAWIIP